METRPPKGHCPQHGETRRETRETKSPKGGHSIQQRETRRGDKKGNKEDKTRGETRETRFPKGGRSIQQRESRETSFRKTDNKGNKKDKQGDKGTQGRTKHPTNGKRENSPSFATQQQWRFLVQGEKGPVSACVPHFVPRSVSNYFVSHFVFHRVAHSVCHTVSTSQKCGP